MTPQIPRLTEETFPSVHRWTCLLLGLLLGCGMMSVAPAQSLPGWNLVWADEFDRPEGSPPDPAKWGYDIGGGGWGNNEWQYYTDRTNNARIQGGQLTIEARAESYGGRDYTSARLLTRDKWTWTYGRMEARIKVPRGQGIWPAFWMLGDNIGSVGWPACGEIDIMEHIGREPKKVYGTIHGPGYSGGEGIGGNYTFTPDVAEEFRVFAIEWQTNLIRWYVDGIQYFSVTPASLGGDTWVFDHPHFLLLNLAVGGNWPGYPDATTVFPQQLLVDYVRVYAATNNTPPPTNSGVLLNGNFETGALAPWIGKGGVNANQAGGTIVNHNGLVWDPTIPPSGANNTQGIKNPAFGTYSCKVYGDYSGSPNSTGFYQDVAVLPGSAWTAGIKARTQHTDHLRSPAQAVAEVSFLNSASTVLAKYASQVFHASSPTNTWMDLTVTQRIVPAGGTTNKLHAPPGTVKARFEVAFAQTLWDWGSIYFDDAQLQQVVLQPTTLAVSVNGSGVQLSFPTLALLQYRVLYKTNSTDPSWSQLTTVAGDGTVKTVSDSLQSGHRLYAVETVF